MPFKSQYRGITYPPFLFHFLGVWKRFCCPRGWHLWDEVESIHEHTLYCDACEMDVHIDHIEEPTP